MSSKSKARPKRDLSAAHRARHENAVIRRYLRTRDEVKPRQGRRNSAEVARRRLIALHTKFAKATDPIHKLVILSRIDNTERTIFEIEASDRRRKEFLALQEEFIEIMKPFSERLDISFEAWVAYGLPPSIVRKGGLHPKF